MVEEEEDESTETLDQTDDGYEGLGLGLPTMQLGIVLMNELRANCPELSGNLYNHIRFTSFGENKVNIKMTGNSYDMNYLRKTGRIKYDGRYDYANWLNIYGAFGRGGADVGWVTETVLKSVLSFASAYNATIIVL